MTVTIDGATLTINEIDAVARERALVRISEDPAVRERMNLARKVVEDAAKTGTDIYGITTLFGGLAHVRINPDELCELQQLAVWHLKSTTGPRLPTADVRAAMLLRANSLVKGASGVRVELVERLVAFLNAGAHPHVHERGSIGASGDLVPLSYIAGAILGLAPDYRVDIDGETLDALTALDRLGLKPLAPEPKEGLALVNGTGASTGVAANVLARGCNAIVVALGVHALFAQALLATDQSFDPFVHAMKPHPGQVWVAEGMAGLLKGSKAIRSEAAGERDHRADELIQDRYGVRCLPQFIGPILDGLATACQQITVEANTANDNPLIDPDSGEVLHTGNFLAQYTAVAMDSHRYLTGLLCKHIDSQIAHLITPAFSNGLSAALVGNTENSMNVGLKSLHVGANQMMTQISYLGQPVADRFPTHAEMHNQNINSQAMTAANLGRAQMDLVEHYLAAALLTGVQAVEDRARRLAGTCDARTILSPATAPLYLAARRTAGGEPEAGRMLHWNDMDGFIQPRVEALLDGITGPGEIADSLSDCSKALWAFVTGTMPENLA